MPGNAQAGAAGAEIFGLVAGPKPADVVATPVPDENLQDTGVPGVVLCTPTFGIFSID